MGRNTTAIVVAAGKGSRMGTDKRKPFLELLGKPILMYSLETLSRSKYIQNIVLVIDPLDGEIVDNMIKTHDHLKHIIIAFGGETRQESVYNGIISSPVCDIVLVHDAARPFIDDDIITRSIEDAYNFGASVVSIPVTNTIKEADEDGFVKNTLKRDQLFEAQTPQTFRAKLFLEAAEYARKNSIKCTDDASLLENFGIKVKITKGNEKNIKITTSKDLYIANQIIKK